MTQTTTEQQSLMDVGRQLRIESIRLADSAGSGHPTSSMSAADLIAVLATRHLRIDPRKPDALGNDHVLFSKGHATPLLYATYAAAGLIGHDELSGYRQRGSRLEGHPTPAIPGVAAATGSLGLGLPIGVGLALAARDLDRSGARTWVLCGDSEMTEGSMAEAIDYAGWAELRDLIAIVDVNRLGQTGPTRYGWDLDHYARRFDASGWHTVTIDGHDVDAIHQAYVEAERADRPSAVIARTHKGSGVSETDDQPDKHGAPLDDPAAAIEELGGRRPITIDTPRPELIERSATTSDRTSYVLPSWPVGEQAATRDAFGAGIRVLAGSIADLVALDAEVGNSTRLDEFAESAPDRFYQLHIAEQLQFSVGIGLQASGWRPVISTFGAFCSRALDVLRMASVSGADLLVVGSHAGVSIGEDGPSQMALEDLAMMRSIHGSTVLSPCDANQTVQLLEQLIDRPGISYLRTLRGATPVVYESGTVFEIGGSQVLRQSPDDRFTVVATGATVPEAIVASDALAQRGTAVRVIDAYSVKPLDADRVALAAYETGRLVVVEDHRPEGGLGEAVLAALADQIGEVTVSHLAVRTMPGSATPSEQRQLAGIDAGAIVAAIEDQAERLNRVGLA